MLSEWGQSGTADLDNDGTVGGADLAILLSSWGPCQSAPRATPLACVSLASYPWAHFALAYNAAANFSVGIDSDALGISVGSTADCWVVADRSAAEWAANAQLVDVRGAAQAVTVLAGGLQANRFAVTGAASLSADNGLILGRGYDMVVDLDRDGTLSGNDLIDGAEGPGFTVVRDPAATGPLAVTNVTYTASGATAGFTSAKVYYPTSIASLGVVPVVIISHGNGHQYTWNDYLGNHLASWGYVVMSHQNNTVPGIETCSTTTLQHTAALFNQQATIASGALNGRMDNTRIIWIGHSRGGDGICRAYDRLFDNSYSVPSAAYNTASIKLLIPIAPTDFNGQGAVGSGSDPHACAMMMLYGAADGDVCGCPNSNVAMSFNLYERCEGDKASCYIHGADHNDFNCCGVNDFAGPSGTALGTAPVQTITKGQILASIQWKLGTSKAATEYLWRQWEMLRPPSTVSTATVVRDFVPLASAAGHVIDDFTTQTAISTSSSGGAVTATVTGLAEGLMNDANADFTWLTSDSHNGATRVGVGDTQRSAIFEWTTPTQIQWTVVAAQKDFSTHSHVQIRAAQTTRHPQTVAQATTSLTFTLTLQDETGASASVPAAAFGGGVQKPYQRTGYGTGAGWQDEIELIRIPLESFRVGGGVDLTRIALVRLSFGTGAGTGVGRLEIDDLMTVRE